MCIFFAPRFIALLNLERKWAHKTEIRQERWHIKKAENYYRRFKRIFECYSFNSILEYRKIGKILLICILFLQNMILNKAIRSISYKIRQILLCFLRNFVVSGSCLHEFEMCYRCDFQK